MDLKFESLIRLNFLPNLWHPIQLSSNLTTHSSLFHILMYPFSFHNTYALILLDYTLIWGILSPFLFLSFSSFSFFFYFFSLFFSILFFFSFFFVFLIFFLYTRISMHKVLHLINTWVCTQFPIISIKIQNYLFIHPMSQGSHIWMILTHTSLS